MQAAKPDKDALMAEQNKPDSSGDGDNDSGRPSNTPKPPQPFMSRNLMGWLVIGGLMVFFLFVMTRANNQSLEVSPQEFITWAQEDRFTDTVVVKDDEIVGTLDKNRTDGFPAELKPPYRVRMAISPQTKELWVAKLYEAKGNNVKIKEDPGSSIWVQLLVGWGPILFILFLIYFFIFRSIRGAGGGGGMLGNFGRSRAKLMNKETSTVTLDDVAGIDEAKDEVSEIIEFLKFPKKFQRLGGRVPRGVLLIGSPGCGKTLLAKAVAGEADVPFFSISGSDFVEMFVGVGASRVRDLFKQAKESSPCIIFLDEIDAVGRKRGSGFTTGGHDEREQTLNAILVEMDGFESNDQIIVMAATNRADVLDPALTRPGRFDRSIQVPLPDIRGRYEILKVHSRRVKMGPDVDFEKIAKGTPAFSGADLAALINEAAIGATLQNKDYVELDDLEEARDKVRWGRSRKSLRLEESERERTAYHEAGHALLTMLEDDSEPLHKVTIIPRGPSLGATYNLPEKDRFNYSKKQLLAMLRITYGGRIAEQLVFDDVCTGAAMDIKQATSIVKSMVTEYGMSDKLGFQLFGTDDSHNPFEQPHQAYSEDTARMIDEEVKSIIAENYAKAEDMLVTNREKLNDIAKALLRYETLTRDEVQKVLDGEKLNKSTISDLLQAEKDKKKDDQDGVVIAPEADTPDFDGGPMPAPA